MVEAVADRLAEAFAEKLHEIVRKEIWAYAPDEALSADDLLKVKYQGTVFIRHLIIYLLVRSVHVQRIQSSKTLWALLPYKRVGAFTYPFKFRGSANA